MSSIDILEHYDRWLASTPLAPRTRVNYRRWVAELIGDLLAGGELAAFLATAADNERRAVLTDWRRRLVDRGLAPATVNLALASATSLLDSQALACPTVPRVRVGAGDARALTAPQLRALEKATDRLASPRDRAIVQVLLPTGLRIGELAALDRGDVQLTQRTGQLVVRHGKGDRYRVVPLSRSARQALKGYSQHKPKRCNRTGMWPQTAGFGVRTTNALSQPLRALVLAQSSAVPALLPLVLRRSAAEQQSATTGRST